MKQPHTPHLAVVDLAFVITRYFDAPIDLVYKVWTQPEHFAKWWGPHTFTNPVCEIDLRPGGRFQVVMRSPEGENLNLTGEYLEIIPQQKIVLQMYTAGHTPEWHAVVNAARGLAPDAEPVNPLTTVLFEDAQGKTKVTVEQRFLNNTDRDAFVTLGTGDGWSQSFVKTDSLLATLATEREFIITRTLAAPLALVWQVWSDPEHLAKWWGPNGFTNTIDSFDLRPGGEWLYTMHGPDGTDYPNWMGFKEVVAQERIAYDHGSFPHDPDAFQGEITFAPLGDGQTQVQLRIVLASATMRAGMFEFGAFEGGDQTLSRWNAYVVALKN